MRQKIFLVPALLFSVYLSADPSLDAVNNFKKQTQKSGEMASGALYDLLALDLLQGKYQTDKSSTEGWAFEKYPTAEELAQGIRPRIRPTSVERNKNKSLVPIRYVRGIRPPGETRCIPTKEYRVTPEATCSAKGNNINCVKGKGLARGVECQPEGLQRGTSTFSLDGSAMGSLEENVPEDESQSAFIGVQDFKLVDIDPFANTEPPFGENQVTSVPVVILNYVSHPAVSGLVQALEVKAGNTRALIPLPPPEPPTCRLKLPQLVKAEDGVEVIVEATSVVTNANLNGESMSLNSEQITSEEFREIGKHRLTVDPRELKAVTQRPDSDTSVCILNVEGVVFGPMAAQPATCTGDVLVEFTSPKPPECVVELDPETQEPNKPVELLIRVKNTVTSAVLNNTTPLSFSPAPSANSIGIYSTIINKSGSEEENFNVVLDGPGGQSTCSKKLFPKEVLPPMCSLSAEPEQVKAGESATVTLTATGQAEGATIAGKVVQLSTETNGTATLVYKKSTPNPEQLTATVSSPGGQSTCSVNLGCAPSPAPTCSLVAKPSQVKPGQASDIQLSCIQPISSAQIMGTDVSVTKTWNPRANAFTWVGSTKYKKNGRGDEHILAVARGEGECGSKTQTKTVLRAAPPCRFANPEYSENLKIDVSKFNDYYDVYEKASFIQEIPQTYTETVGTGKNKKTVQKTRISTKTIPCACGQKVGTDKKGNVACVSGAQPSSTKLLWQQTQSYGSDHCTVVNRKEALTVNERKFAQGTVWDLNFQHKVKKIYTKIDKIKDEKIERAYDVVSNLSWSHVGNLQEKKTAYTSEAACTTECPTMEIDSKRAFSNGDLCLSSKVSEALRTTGTGRKAKTELDSDAICTSEAIVGTPVSAGWTGVTTKAVPGKFEVDVNELIPGTHRKSNNWYAVEKICKENHLCVVETTPAPTGNVSNQYFWVEVGPVDDENCSVTMIDTAITVRDKGCFIGDTKVRMANGTDKEVQDIRNNDYVWNPHYQMGVRVRKVAKGPERKPLYEVLIGSHRVKVTEDHPFLTGRGWLQTADLKKGDWLFGEGEGKVITQVRKLPFSEPVDVWNFELDTDDPLAHLVIANGIPTGDLVTQVEIKNKGKQVP
jgi:hypothetical protein